LTLSATVTPAGNAGADPTGTVTFTDNGTPIGSGTISTSGGVTRAELTTAKLAGGSHPITASYAGDSNYAPSATPSAFRQTIQSKAPLHQLTVSTPSGGGTVSIAATGCSGTCSATFTSGSVVTLTPHPAPGWTFAGWSGGNCIGTDPCAVTMSQAQDIKATFIHAPPPTFRRNSDVATVSGTVRIRLPGAHTFVTLTDARQIPLGALVDTTHGVAQVVLAKRDRGTLEGQYWIGEFTLSQSHSGAVTATLQGGNLASCPAVRRHAPDALIARGRPRRRLWSNVHGSFTSRGHSASGSVRGTEWLTADYCDGTSVSVDRGAVLVTDLRRHRSKLVHAGHSTFVAA
jgi:hypothetical protein